jgi:hypothetical protein
MNIDRPVQIAEFDLDREIRVHLAPTACLLIATQRNNCDTLRRRPLFRLQTHRDQEATFMTTLRAAPPLDVRFDGTVHSSATQLRSMESDAISVTMSKRRLSANPDQDAAASRKYGCGHKGHLSTASAAA